MVAEDQSINQSIKSQLINSSFNKNSSDTGAKGFYKEQS